MSEPGPWLTVNDAAAYLAVSRATMYGLMRDGWVTWRTVGTRRRIHVNELDRYVNARTRLTAAL